MAKAVMTVAQAISNLFRRRAEFIVVGLTGRTGSGCTTSSQLLSRSLALLPLEPIASPLQTPEQRKFRIIRNFADQNWQPFTVVSVTQAIASFVFDLNSTAIKDFFSPYIKNAQALSTFLSEIERIKPLWEIVASVVGDRISTPLEEEDQAFFQLWDGEIKSFLGVARTALGSSFSQVFQTMGDNLRSSGTITSSETIPNAFYKLPHRVSQIVVGARRLNIAASKPARFVIDALRNPFEIQFYRQRFAGFYLIAVTTPDKDRKSRLQLKDLNNKDIKKLDEKEYPSENKPLAGYAHFVSQNIQACIEKADIFIHNPGEAIEGQAPDLKALCRQLLTFSSLMQHPGLVTPSKVERCMQIAYSAKANSGCISRQVGAAVTDENYSIKAVGWNDVPAGQISCLLRQASDLLGEQDEEAFSEYERHDEKFKARVDSRYKRFSTISAEGRSSAFCFKSEYNALDGKNKGNQVHTRSLHAEENAFLQISKYGGSGVFSGILFSTASPCELCSKKAFQLGIKKIYYIDPYPGISLDHILSSGPSNLRPAVTLFQGAVGQAFHRLYDPILPYKDEVEVFLSPPTVQPTDHAPE